MLSDGQRTIFVDFHHAFLVYLEPRGLELYITFGTEGIKQTLIV